MGTARKTRPSCTRLGLDGLQNGCNHDQHSTLAAAQSKHSAFFGKAHNAVMRNERLSLELRGLLAIVSTFPQDGSWVWHRDHLLGLCNCGMRKFRGVIREAKRSGFLKTIRRRYFWNLNPDLGAETSPIAVEPGADLGAETSPISKRESSERERSTPATSSQVGASLENQTPEIQKQGGEGDSAVQMIGGGKKENCAKERKAPARAEDPARVHRHKLRTEAIDELYKHFCKNVGLDPQASPMTPKERGRANECFGECANSLRKQANAEHWSDQKWVDNAADMVAFAIDEFVAQKWRGDKSWFAMCKIETFRGLLASEPQKESRL